MPVPTPAAITAASCITSLAAFSCRRAGSRKRVFFFNNPSYTQTHTQIIQLEQNGVCRRSSSAGAFHLSFVARKAVALLNVLFLLLLWCHCFRSDETGGRAY